MPACSCLDGSCPEGPGHGAAVAPGFSRGTRAERRGGGPLCAGRVQAVPQPQSQRDGGRAMPPAPRLIAGREVPTRGYGRGQDAPVD